MIFKKSNKSDPKKAIKLELKGDKLNKAQKFKMALIAYQQALLLNPDNPILYEKMAAAQSQIEGEWSEKEFVDSMDWIMKKQELENPQIKETLETLHPEYQQIKQLIAQMLMMDPVERDPILLKIKSFKEKSVLPLLDILLALDALSRGALRNVDEQNAEKEGLS